MAIFEIFSKRQKKLRGEFLDIFTYDEIPETLKIQIIHLIKDTIGTSYNTQNSASKTYKEIHNTLCREYGMFQLGDRYDNSDQAHILSSLLNNNDVEKNLDIIELSFQHIDQKVRNRFSNHSYDSDASLKPDDAIKDLNKRFMEHGIGYSFEGGEILRVDSSYIHCEITKPTISLLWNENFIGANEEYLKAHEHYRHGRNKECLTECLKAFESTLKIICSKKKWEFKQTDTANKLIQICFDNELVPKYTQNQFTSLKNLLESGIPTIRNRLGGHGQGETLQKVDNEMTRYGLNLTGTNIIFLIEQSQIK